MTSLFRTGVRGRAPVGSVLPAILLALSFGAPRARAADASWAKPGVPATVTAGQTVVLELGDAPPDVDELEILLSLDDGRSFPVRVTREIQPGEREVRWKVPALATTVARLRVRFGEHSGGAREHETWGPMSAAFAIITHGEESDLHVFHENGWWEGLDPAPAPAAADLDPSAPRLEAGVPAPSVALPSLNVSIGRTTERPIGTAGGAIAAPPASPDRSSIRERYFPLRH